MTEEVDERRKARLAHIASLGELQRRCDTGQSAAWACECEVCGAAVGERCRQPLP